MARHALIIGGTGQIGRAVGAALLDRGWRVTLSSRGTRPPPEDLVERGAAIARLDRDEPGSLTRVLAGGADAVIDSMAFHETHADQLLALGGNVGAFVVISSASVYRDADGRTLDEARKNGFPNFPEPIRETQPTVEPGPDTYSTRKVALERRLLERARQPVTILRPSAIHGPHSSHPREWWFVKRMLDQRRVIPLAYRGESRFHTCAAANIATLVATALDRPQSQILNVADPTAPTVAEIGNLIARQMNYDGVILPIDVADDRGSAALGRSPWSTPAPFTLNTDAAGSLGYQPATSYANAVGEICRWLTSRERTDWKADFPILAGYSRELFDYAEEDAYLAARSAPN